MVNGQWLTFDLLGLQDGVFLMRDRQTGTVWQHLDGRAISGPMTGERLEMIPLLQTSWESWREAHSDTSVLSLDTPYQNQYRQIRTGFVSPDEVLYGDDRLPSNALVLGVEVDGSYRGYTLSWLQQEGGIINGELAGEPIVALYDAKTGAAIAFSSVVDGVLVTFHLVDVGGLPVLEDESSGSRWDVSGKGISGSLSHVDLTFTPSIISEWYGWSAYHPDTELVGEAS